MGLINELNAIKARLDALEDHRDARIKDLEDKNDRLTQRIEALEKRKK